MPFEITGRTISGEDFTIKSEVGFTEGSVYSCTESDNLAEADTYSVMKDYKTWTDRDNPFMLAKNLGHCRGVQ